MSTPGWIEDPAFTAGQPFGPQTLPYGVLEGIGAAVRVGDSALPLNWLPLGERLDGLLGTGNLDALLAAGRGAWDELRERLTELVHADSAPPGARLVELGGERLPFTVADYVDFYSSRNHAENAGRIFRPDAAALLPNWTHLPVGYHGRAGTVVVSGTDVRRPHGQRKSSGDLPEFGPSVRLDIEAEVGFVCGGEPASQVSTAAVAEHVFGVVLLNDWSARDIQGWESAPLGPFLGKSFATSISGWITPLAAFEHARCPVPQAPHALQDYLVEQADGGIALELEVRWNDTVVSRPPFAGMNWSPAQQLAHLTVNGATVRPGDLFGSGTVTGPEQGQRGSFLELSWGGAETITLDGGEERTFLLDGDTVVITATAPGPDGSVVGLAEVRGTVLPAERR